MPRLSPAAAARRLLTVAPGSSEAAADVAERMAADLTTALTRWFGPYGTHALLTRALVQARAAHPVLAAVRVRAPLTPGLDGLADVARADGAEALAEGVGAVLAAVVELLGRLIGEDMALQLVERSMDDIQARPQAHPPVPPPPPAEPPDGGTA